MPAGDSRQGPDPSRPGTVYRAKPKLRARRGGLKGGLGTPTNTPNTPNTPNAPASAPAQDGYTRTWTAGDPGGLPPSADAYAAPPGPPSPPQPAPSGSGPRGPRRPRLRVRWVVLAVVLALVAYPFLLALTAWTHLGRTDALSTSSVADTPGTTYLVVGSDSREKLSKAEQKRLGTGDVAGRRTDTIMVLHVPDGGGPTVLMSIPRDSYVSIPGHGKNKINAAYAFGGESLLVKTVEKATGLHLDHYAETGFGGFADIVDAVGGVDICVKHAMKDKKAKLNVKKGCQTMDGATALGYSRARYSDVRGDLGRVERQREVLAAIAKKTFSPGVIVQPWRAFPAAAAGGGALTFDEDAGPLDVARFLKAMRSSAGGNGLSLTVPVANANLSTSAGSAVSWDDAKAERVFDAIRDDDTERIRPIAKEQADLAEKLG